LYAEEQVRRGIAFLDARNDPSWRQYVNWDMLDMRNQELCVLGQLYGSYGLAVRRLGIDLESTEPSSLGFCRFQGCWVTPPAHEFEGLEGADREWERRYELLTQTWKQIMAPVLV
jgi:hypothetical protein